MRPIFIAAATVLLCGPALATGGSGIGKGLMPLGSVGPQKSVADHIQLGRVTAVDPANMTFACHWKTGDWTYQVGSTANFRMGNNPASFSDLKVGQTVQVLFHFQGKTEVANLVVIEQ